MTDKELKFLMSKLDDVKEEKVEVLMAISVISKRLARALDAQRKAEIESDESDELDDWLK